MFPKPFDLDRALATLRQERPSSEAPARARLALQNSLLPEKGRGGAPARRRLARPLTITMITAALAVVVFTPRTHAGAAWAQTLAATLDAPAIHSVELLPDGRKGLEEWRSGAKRAHVLYTRDGKPAMEWRDDGKKTYNYAAMFTDPKSPNSRRWGMVSKSFGRDFFHEMPYGSAERILKTPGVEVVAHEEPAQGRPETYRLRIPAPLFESPKLLIVAELDAEGRVDRLTRPGEPGEQRIDYPASIPDSVFAPRPHAISGVDVYDLQELGRTIQRTLRKGLGKQGPITLRLVTLDGYGTLWAFWTGALPNARMSRPIRIPGVRGNAYATKKALTSDWKMAPYTKFVPNVTGQRIGGMSFVPQSKLESTIDLDIPYPGGIARFKDIPVLRVGLLNHYEDRLGVMTVYAPIGKSK